MRHTITAAKALAIAKDIAAQRRKWGKQVNPPYTPTQLFEVFELLDEAGHFSADLADVQKLRRQLNVAAAREKGLRKQLGQKVTEYGVSSDGDDNHSAEPGA